ncbi:thioesterase-like superfamily-domain-containing protein [Lineolata rhizophorae]|uniref:Thioesterase-like superfamily-domain-containing protein n=1 Tax=Lineolata rhizophorae TaxID=578093 RepID=A0A6A6P6Q9_9PEZI|nr:thioesterase-like superfamily-domain-containing protein [Lineolata rhizophorae]
MHARTPRAAPGVRPLVPRSRPPAPRAQQHAHHRSRRSCSSTSGSGSGSGSGAAAAAGLPSRWLADVAARLGKCVHFGLGPAQARVAAGVARDVGQDWRGLVAGSEGYLTGEGRRGLWRHEVQWGEMVGLMDVFFFGGHVNNVMYNRYAESARVNWALNYARRIDPAHAREWRELVTPRNQGLIMKSIRTDFKFPMTYPDRITVLHKLRSPPSSSSSSSSSPQSDLTLDVLILSELHRRPAARCVEELVLYDYRAGRKARMPDWMVEVLSRTWAEQEEAKVLWGGRARDLEERVRELERGSWDREGAVEDFGTGGKG